MDVWGVELVVLEVLEDNVELNGQGQYHQVPQVTCHHHQRQDRDRFDF